MADALYLGYADYLPNAHTRIACVAKATDGKWQRKDDFSRELPPVGKVFAVPSAAASDFSWIKLHQPVAITAIPNPRQVADENKDKLVVHQILPVRQVMDFRQSGMEGARSFLLEKGAVRTAPFSKDLVAAISDDQCVVVTLFEHPVTGRLVAPSGSVKIFEFNAQVFEGDTFDGLFLEVPERTVGEFKENIDWHLDQDLLDLVLKRLKKFDAQGPSKNERERIVAVLNRASAFVQEAPDLHYLQDWLDGYIARNGSRLEAAPVIAAQLAELSPVQAELEKLRERAINELRHEIEPEVRGAIERDLEALYLQKKHAEDDLKAKQEKINEWRSEYDEIRSDAVRFRQQLLKEVGEVNAVLGDTGNHDSEDFQALVERLGESLGASSGLLQPADYSIPPWGGIRQETNASSIPFPEFAARLASVAKRTGLEPEDVMLMDTALRSGVLTVLPQEAAEIMVPLYASLATGRDFVRQPLGPGILNLDDMWTDPVRGTLTGFARAWITAQRNSQRFHLVWLDGLQRTPIDVWVPSLVGALTSQHRPQNLLVMASIDTPFLDRERKWPEFEKACVPLNPSLAGLRAARHLADANNSESVSTFLYVSNSNKVDREDFADCLDDAQEENPVLVPLEAQLYKAEGQYAEGDISVSERLRQTASRRLKGRNWLKKLLDES
ncbi:hypothetical protein [Halomonas mongoliensis]|uniref:hypothetical protein n=1 Tax=Halomonas mongoliensis TaxID=321265 RepID=UPI00403AAC41